MAATIALVIFLVATLLGAGLFIASRYKRCPSDKILVVYGKTAGNEPQYYHGGGALVLPFVQGHAYLDLAPLPVELRGRGLRTADESSVDVVVDLAVAVTRDPQLIPTAAERLLHIAPADIAALAKDIGYGVLDQTVAECARSELTAADSKTSMLTAFLANYEPEIAKVGVEVQSIRIVNVSTSDTERRDTILVALGEVLTETRPSPQADAWRRLKNELDELATARNPVGSPANHRPAADEWKEALRAWARAFHGG